MVRDALGEDAVIIATREEKSPKGEALFHITAAVEREMDTHYQDLPFTDWHNGEPPDGDGEGEEQGDAGDICVTEELTDALLYHAAPEEVLDQLLSCASILAISEPRQALLAALESLYKFAPLSPDATPLPLMMVGQPGAGKTLATAKLTARAILNDRSVAVITTDTQQAGGKEQLEAFTRLMDVVLHVASNPEELAQIYQDVKDHDQVYIDMAGVNPFLKEDIKRLAQFIGAIECDPVLVLPANTNAEEAGEMGKIFADIGVMKLMPTRIDAARRLGSLLAAAYSGGLAFTEISSTPKVAEGLSSLTSKRLTQLLMPHIHSGKAS